MLSVISLVEGSGRNEVLYSRGVREQARYSREVRFSVLPESGEV